MAKAWFEASEVATGDVNVQQQPSSPVHVHHNSATVGQQQEHPCCAEVLAARCNDITCKPAGDQVPLQCTRRSDMLSRRGQLLHIRFFELSFAA